MTILVILVGLLILSIMMIVHELGHFLAGKALGFKILSYNIFMGPILWSRRGKDGVLYTIRLLPIGASVEFAGETAESVPNVQGEDAGAAAISPDDPGLFFKRPRWARAIVIFMGPFINFVTAFLALAILFLASGVSMPIIGEVKAGSVAELAGIQAEDRIVSMDGLAVHSSLDLSMAEMFGNGGNLDLGLRHSDGRVDTITLRQETVKTYRLGIMYTPRPDGRMIVESVQSEEGKEQLLQPEDEILSVDGRKVTAPDFLELSGEPEKTIEARILRQGKELTLKLPGITAEVKKSPGYSLRGNKNAGEALGQALIYPWSIIRSTVRGIGQIFTGRLKARDGLAGPVAIVGMVGGVVREKISFVAKIYQLLLYFGFISVAVGFTNLLPIPPFDGFHLLTLAIEGTIRRDLPLKLKNAIATIGFFIIIALAVLVFYLDITRLLGF